jgi:putative peptidoglycan lipid II flippase
LSQVAKSSLIVTIFTAVSLGFGVLSNIVIAAKFGAGKDMDVFLAATTLPLFITSILSGSLNFTFIPVFAEYRAKGPDEVWKVVSSFINLNVVITAVLCLIGILFANTIIKTLTPGFTEERLVRSAELLRWLFPIIIFAVINELMASVYYSNQRFVVPSLNKIISPLITIAYVLLFHNSLSTHSIVFAMLTAVFVQTGLLVIGFFRAHDFHYSFVFDYRHPGVVKILKLMTPLVLGMIIYRSVPIFDRYFLSRLPEGSISHIGYAMKLLSIIPPIIVSGISVSIFPVMSKYAAEENRNALKEIMSKGIRMFYFLSIPFVVLLGVYGKPIIQLIFERKAFTSADTTAVYYAFAIYLLTLPASAVGSIVSQGFYVLQENKTIAIIGIVMMGLYVGLCAFFMHFLDYLTIPVAYAVYHNCAIFTTFMVIKKKIGINWQVVLSFLLKSTMVAVAVMIILYPSMRLKDKNMFLSAALCALGFLFYFLISKFVLAIDEANLIWQTVLFRLKERVSL